MEITKLNNHRVFKIKCHGATNYRPSRVSIVESRLGRTDRTYLTWSQKLPNKEEVFQSENVINGVERYLNSIGINCVAVAHINNESLIFSDSWANENNEFINIKGEKL